MYRLQAITLSNKKPAAKATAVYVNPDNCSYLLTSLAARFPITAEILKSEIELPCRRVWRQCPQSK
jgi:hypothetical protein